MHRFIIVALAVLTVASCDRFPHNGLQITGMLPLEENCSLDPTTDLRQTRGLWDVADPAGDFPRTAQFWVTPLFESYIISRATDIQAEQNNLQITNLEVTLETPDGERLELPGLPNPYTVTASANLAVAVTDSFSSSSTFSIAIPPSYRQPVRDAVFGAGFDELIVAFKAIGTTMGGFTQNSATFFWPVQLCEGCLDLCPSQAAADALSGEELPTTCLPGQDAYPYCQYAIPPPPDPMTP